MHIAYFSKKIFYVGLQLTLVTITSLYGNSLPSTIVPNPQNSNASSAPQNIPRYEREEIAFADRNEDKTLYEKNLNLGNWDYKENWRYDKQAFYNGETQSDAYDQRHPGLRGIGYDATDRSTYHPQYEKNSNCTAPTYREGYYKRAPQEDGNNYCAQPSNKGYSDQSAYPYSTTQNFDSRTNQYTNPSDNFYQQ
ncbi:hypothetical protein [Candidatus Protochlamydia amoebophila]|uniref:Uncharacterized protein n=1 Tax=Protochlamydia amoebophila (strain UWE25) TaxID=264201 RepID=Q6MF89_PARUW|nr:hypothetical protein [Candidatus Protochlamydia amoebophila]CAF22760.1 unnamed protein product [Candidatus Protochlamydia amoebophila UWE25]